MWRRGACHLAESGACGRAAQDSRIALVGPNGAGKSTLLKLMTGALEPLDGMVKRHNHLKIGQYHQHLAELLDPELTPLECALRPLCPGSPPARPRGGATGTWLRWSAPLLESVYERAPCLKPQTLWQVPGGRAPRMRPSAVR